ncbi:MAG TPA: helix-turn-helix domain-containing protein [Ktedonobacteraceae bacterium]|nr:helix-turn-helix domain-containing protein [Ktedonobacteraceae bacterium]
MKKPIICLSPEQRQALQQIIKAGNAPARQILHAHILLKIDASEFGPNWSNKQIQEACEAVESTVWRVRARFLAEGLPSAVAAAPYAYPDGIPGCRAAPDGGSNCRGRAEQRRDGAALAQTLDGRGS